MQRTTAPDNVGNMFSDGTPGITPGTEIEQVWLNSVQEELCNAITADGTALNVAVQTQLRALFSGVALSAAPAGRLTLSTGVPITTSDVTAATTVYFTPYKGSKIALWNGTYWALYPFSELSQLTTDTTKSPAAVAANKNYDVYVWNDAGTLRATRGPAWTTDTSRGTGAGTAEQTTQDGRIVNKQAITNGPGAKLGLYVGTIRSDGSSQINDSQAKRHVWNEYNYTERSMKVVETAGSWAGTGSLQQANANAANQLDFVCGQADAIVEANVLHSWSNNGTTSTGQAAIGLDSTSAVASDCVSVAQQQNEATGGSTPTFELSAAYRGVPGLGRHLLTWLERAGSGSALFLGTTIGGASGIFGSILA